MPTREQLTELYKNGICDCKATGKWSYKIVPGILVCVRCRRPKYWPDNTDNDTPAKPSKPSKPWWEYK